MSFDEFVILAVWKKARIHLFYDADDVREDEHGTLIKYEEYGNRDSKYGWEIDHIVPKALGGGDDLSNLRTLHWRANASRQFSG